MAAINHKKFFEKQGHFGVYGPTGCGKTYYVKHLIKSMGGNLKSALVFVKRRCAYGWRECKTIYNEVTTDTLSKAETIAQLRCEDNKTTWIVFDDFLDDRGLGGKVATKFADIFTSGRHAKIRAVFLVQHGAMVPPAVRKNVSGIIFPANCQIDMVKNIAKLYLQNDWLALREFQGKAEGGRYNMLIANAIRTRILIDKAPPPGASYAMVPKTKSYDIEEIRDDDQLFEPTLDDVLGDDDDDDTEDMGFRVGGPKINMGNHNTAGRDYYDGSTNNYAVKLDMDYKMEVKMEKNSFKIAKLRKKHERILRKEDSKDQAIRIINKAYMSPRDENKLVAIMNSFNKSGPRITTANYEEYLPSFCEHVLRVEAPRERTFVDRSVDYGISYLGDDSITGALTSYFIKNTGILDTGQRLLRRQ